MSRKNWDDEKVEYLLRQLPGIKDERSKDIVYNKVRIQLNSRKRRNWILPSMAYMLAVCLIFIIGQSFFNFTPNEEKSSYNALSSGENKNVEIANKKEEENTEIFQFSDESIMEQKTTPLSVHAIYEDEINGQEVLTYPIPDANIQVVVPVSILVNNPNQLSRFDLYKQNIDAVKNNNIWNLSTYAPFDSSMLTYDSSQKIVKVDFKQDLTNVGSHSDEFFQTLVSQQLETIGAEKMAFYTNGKEGAIIGNRVESIVEYQPLQKRAYFLLQDADEKEETVYVPWEEAYPSIKQALKAMKRNMVTYGLVASIPETMSFSEIKEMPSKQHLVIRFTNESTLLEDRKTLDAIESILLTAKEFNYQTVKFENTNITKIGRFDLTEKLVVPIAANKMDI